ncbi:MAG: hypothetical protein ACI9OJ_002110, partial [Myxococcota bacterium]
MSETLRQTPLEKNMSEPRLGGAAGPKARPGRAGFVARRSALEQLYNLMHTAVATDALQLVVMTGAAGVGKSRLVDEFIALLEGGERGFTVFRP